MRRPYHLTVACDPLLLPGGRCGGCVPRRARAPRASTDGTGHRGCCRQRGVAWGGGRGGKHGGAAGSSATRSASAYEPAVRRAGRRHGPAAWVDRAHGSGDAQDVLFQRREQGDDLGDSAARHRHLPAKLRERRHWKLLHALRPGSRDAGAHVFLQAQVQGRRAAAPHCHRPPVQYNLRSRAVSPVGAQRVRLVRAWDLFYRRREQVHDL